MGESSNFLTCYYIFVLLITCMYYLLYIYLFISKVKTKPWNSTLIWELIPTYSQRTTTIGEGRQQMIYTRASILNIHIFVLSGCMCDVCTLYAPFLRRDGWTKYAKKNFNPRGRGNPDKIIVQTKTKNSCKSAKYTLNKTWQLI